MTWQIYLSNLSKSLKVVLKAYPPAPPSCDRNPRCTRTRTLTSCSQRTCLKWRNEGVAVTKEARGSPCTSRNRSTRDLTTFPTTRTAPAAFGACWRFIALLLCIKGLIVGRCVNTNVCECGVHGSLYSWFRVVVGVFLFVYFTMLSNYSTR